MSEDRMVGGRVLFGARPGFAAPSLATGLTLFELAEHTQLALSCLSEVERGRKLTSLGALGVRAVALGVLVVDVLSQVYACGVGNDPRVWKRYPTPLLAGPAPSPQASPRGGTVECLYGPIRIPKRRGGEGRTDLLGGDEASVNNAVGVHAAPVRRRCVATPATKARRAPARSACPCWCRPPGGVLGTRVHMADRLVGPELLALGRERPSPRREAGDGT